MRLPKLNVAFACDAEDNHPNYVPGWEKYGGNYDVNPAILNWNWTKYWADLSECFVNKNAPVTWLIRVDNGPVYDTMLKLYKDIILELKSKKDEIGIHIHTWSWDKTLSQWTQTTNPLEETRIVSTSLKLFKKHLGFNPLSSRMGWTAMSNEIMRTLNDGGIIAESSAVPGIVSSGKFAGRDNIFDWSRVKSAPYHPDKNDYQSSGKMRILEIPISSLESHYVHFFGKLVRALSSKKFLVKFASLARWLNLSPHESFNITPWWSISVNRTIINSYAKKARRDGNAFLVGTFHPSDILDPKTGYKNLIFEKCISSIMNDLSSLKGIQVNFVSLSDIARIIEG